jgi:hypothetical protein
MVQARRLKSRNARLERNYAWCGTSAALKTQIGKIHLHLFSSGFLNDLPRLPAISGSRSSVLLLGAEPHFDDQALGDELLFAHVASSFGACLGFP